LASKEFVMQKTLCGSMGSVAAELKALNEQGYILLPETMKTFEANKTVCMFCVAEEESTILARRKSLPTNVVIRAELKP
jgi:hypothetical protein